MVWRVIVRGCLLVGYGVGALGSAAVRRVRGRKPPIRVPRPRQRLVLVWDPEDPSECDTTEGSWTEVAAWGEMEVSVPAPVDLKQRPAEIHPPMEGQELPVNVESSTAVVSKDSVVAKPLIGMPTADHPAGDSIEAPVTKPGDEPPLGLDILDLGGSGEGIGNAVALLDSVSMGQESDDLEVVMCLLSQMLDWIVNDEKTADMEKVEENKEVDRVEAEKVGVKGDEILEQKEDDEAKTEGQSEIEDVNDEKEAEKEELLKEDQEAKEEPEAPEVSDHGRKTMPGRIEDTIAPNSEEVTPRKKLPDGQAYVSREELDEIFADLEILPDGWKPMQEARKHSIAPVLPLEIKPKPRNGKSCVKREKIERLFFDMNHSLPSDPDEDQIVIVPVREPKKRHWFSNMFKKRRCGEDCCPKELFEEEGKPTLKKKLKSLYCCGRPVF